jgi:hypothetical protein
MWKTSFAMAALALLLGCDGDSQNTPSATTTAAAQPSATAAALDKLQGKVFFVTPLDGAQVFPDVEMGFGVEGPVIGAAGTHARNKGYNVLIVDGEPVAHGVAIPKDDKHISFAAGEMFGEVKLTPGKHKLTLQLASLHGLSYGPTLAQTVEVDVIADEGERSVAITEPADGATIKSKFTIKFDVKGMKIRPAGEAPKDRVTGHHHVLIDVDSMPVGVEIPADKTHVHYGKGQTEAELELEPGEHKLTAQFADGSHRSFGKKMSHTIKVMVTP